MELREKNKPACNERFCEMAAVAPQTILYVIARLSPAGTLVKPPPRKAARTLHASFGTAHTTPKQTKNEIQNEKKSTDFFFN